MEIKNKLGLTTDRTIKIINPFYTTQLFNKEFIEEFETNYKNKTKIIVIVLSKFILSAFLKKYTTKIIINSCITSAHYDDIKTYYY
jgi:hypothetical protein